MIPLGMHFLLILFNKPNLPQSANRCDVIVTQNFTKVKCFSYRALPTLASYSDSNFACCSSAAEQSKIVFIKHDNGTKDARDIA